MVKNSIALMADSTCDIPEDLIEQYGITIIPELVIWGDKTFRDRVDINTQEFYERIEKTRSGQPPPSPARQNSRRYTRNAISQGARGNHPIYVSADCLPPEGIRSWRPSALTVNRMIFPRPLRNGVLGILLEFLPGWGGWWLA